MLRHVAAPALLVLSIVGTGAGAAEGGAAATGEADRHAPAAAGEGAAPPAPPASATDEAIDSARASVRSTAEWLARGVDSWFGDRPFSQGGKVSDGRLDLAVLQRQRENTQVNLRFNARFRLPNLDRLTYVFIGRDSESEVISDKPGPLSSQDRLLKPPAADTGFFAGLGRALSDEVDLRLGVRGRFEVYAQARYRHGWSPSPVELVDFRQTLFWTSVDRVGSTTAVSYERLWSPVLVLRWVNAATTTQNQPKFVWSTLLGAYRDYGAQRLFSLEALANGQQGSGLGVGDGGVQVRWEQPVHRDWLIGGIVVGRFWPRPDIETPRTGVWALGVQARMKF